MKYLIIVSSMIVLSIVFLNCNSSTDNSNTNQAKIINKRITEKAKIIASKEPPIDALISRTYDIAVYDKTIYRATCAGVIAESIEKINEPQKKAVVTLPGSVNRFTIDNERKLLYSFSGPDGISILSIEQPESPQKAGYINTPGAAMKGLIKGNYLYVADGSSGIEVYDVSDLTKIEKVSQLQLDGYFRDLIISENILLAAASESGIYLIDISNPQSLQKINQIDTRGDARQIVLQEGTTNYLFVADGHGGLAVVSINRDDRNLPSTIVKTLDISDKARAIKIKDNKLFLGIGPDGIIVYDITQPQSPVQLTVLTLKLAIIGITTYDPNYLLCSNDSGGMVVFTYDQRGSLTKIFGDSE